MGLGNFHVSRGSQRNIDLLLRTVQLRTKQLHAANDLHAGGHQLPRHPI